MCYCDTLSSDYSQWTAPNEQYVYKRAVCTSHMFGRDLATDLAVAQAMDVLVGMHGAGNTWLFFSRRFSSLIEIRPFGFEEHWSNGQHRWGRGAMTWGMCMDMVSLSLTLSCCC